MTMLTLAKCWLGGTWLLKIIAILRKYSGWWLGEVGCGGRVIDSDVGVFCREDAPLSSINRRYWWDVDCYGFKCRIFNGNNEQLHVDCWRVKRCCTLTGMWWWDNLSDCFAGIIKVNDNGNCNPNISCN